MRFIQKILRWPILMVFVICILSFLGTVTVRNMGGLENFELTCYDYFLRSSLIGTSPDPRIVLINITEQDILELGRWPLSDHIAARVLTLLSQYNPRAIGFDIYRDIPVPPGTEELDSILLANQRIITVMKFGGNGVSPPPVLAHSNQVGFNDIIVDPNGTVRRGLLFLDDGVTSFSSFDFLLALRYLQDQGISPQPDKLNPDFLRIGASTIPALESNTGGYIQADMRGYQYLLDYSGIQTPFTSFTLSELLSEKIPPEFIKGKIALVGVTAQSVKDLFYTPYSQWIDGNQQAIPGIVMHAQMVSQLLRLALGESKPILTSTEKQELGWILFWSLLGGALSIWLRSPLDFAVFTAFGLFFLWLAAYFAFSQDWWLPSVSPAISFFISILIVTSFMAGQEKQQKKTLMHLFSKYVSAEVATSIWQQRDLFFEDGRPRSQKMVVTVLFADMKGFTSTAEELEPQLLIDWLNSYMEAMADLAINHKGVVDDYAGDGIKVNFGVPFPRETEIEIKNDAQQAAYCALAMGKKIEELNKVWKKNNLPAAGMRIGIFTGPVVAGVIGSSKRLKYTTVGDAVNIAARLESYDKGFARESCWRILIGEKTKQYLDPHFNIRFIGEENLKGKSKKIAIYQIMEETTETISPKPESEG
jgi:adenylate cyclase